MSVTTRINWTSLSQQLQPSTQASLNAFRRQHAALAKRLADLKESSLDLDLTVYKQSLKNAKVLQEAQKALSSYKPATLNLKERLDFIASQEKAAVNPCFSSKRLQKPRKLLKRLLKNSRI